MSPSFFEVTESLQMETERFLETSLSACKSRQRQDKESSYLYDTPDLEVWGSTLN